MTFSAYVIWSGTLLVILIVIVPIAWSLLNRTLQNAKSIERYSSEMLESGIGIVENTNEIKHLDKTLKSAGKIVTLTESLKKITGKS
jgi:hypothetical protein